MTAKYLIMSEGGETCFIIQDELTATDVLCVQDGTLYIVRLSDMTELLQDGETWRPLSEGEIKFHPDGNYHWIYRVGLKT